MDRLIGLYVYLVAGSTCGILGQKATCPPYGVVYGSRCIWTKDNDNGKGIQDSQATCRRYGGSLVTFSNMTEIRTMMTITKLVTDVIIGATRVEVNGSMTYYWLDTTTEPFFARWDNITDQLEINHTCLAFISDDLRAIPCNSWIRYLCERDMSAPLPTSSGSTNAASSTTPGCVTAMPGAGCGETFITPRYEANTPTIGYVTTPTTSTSTATDTTPGIITDVTMVTTHDRTTQFRKSQIPNKEMEDTLTNIASSPISNMSDFEVKALVTQFSRVVSNVGAASQSDVRKMTDAIVKLSAMETCDKNTFQMYATSVSTVLTMMEPHQEQDNGGVARDGQPDAILEAMEHVLFATRILSMEEIYDSFCIQIVSLNGSQDELDIHEGNYSDHIQLSSSVTAGYGRVSTVVYQNLHRKMSKRSRKYRKAKLGSKVISVSVQDAKSPHKTKVETPNAINFTVARVDRKSEEEKTRICAFWNTHEAEWSDVGCHLLSQNNTHTTCACDHLTSFAVLVLYYNDDKLSDINERVLYILSAVGCSLSILGLAMTLFSFTYLRMLHRERILIHANLAGSLMFAQIIFVASSDAHKSQVLCKVVAILMHFFFMAGFTWMMLEGLCLYLSCLRSHHIYGDMRLKYAVIGWGVPIIIVILSVGIQFPHYGDGPGDSPSLPISCWLSAEHGLIWAFMAPMLLIVIFNLIILGLVIKVFLTLKANSQKSEAARIRASLRAMSMLLPLLGVTWLLSILVPYSTIFHYLFVIGNSLQGLLIFFLHCLCNEEVRKFLAAKRATPTMGTATSDIDDSAFWRRRRSAAALSFDDVQSRCQPNPPGRRHAWT
ncbi:adhesion G-protein coupled receptor D1-like [Haliotis cracherodii]|uniref:adhesion G-protein coupled receptor D1-like n=1 Tax=Haliotis cracherodii TaxID=6455 RepID=UPI0039ED8B42